MIHISWAGFYEGPSDRAYYDVLLPRLMEEIALNDGIQTIEIAITPVTLLGKFGRQVIEVATEACTYRNAIHLLFIHADMGGRALAETIADRSCSYCNAIHKECDWDSDRCITMTPRHETEAWILADPEAVVDALSFNGHPQQIGLPADAAAAEALPDPKAVLDDAIRQVLGRRSRLAPSQVFPAIAQAQDFQALRRAQSFRAFEAGLRRGMASLGCLNPS